MQANEQVFRTILHPPSHVSVGSLSGLEEVALLTGVMAKVGCGSEPSNNENVGEGQYGKSTSLLKSTVNLHLNNYKALRT